MRGGTPALALLLLTPALLAQAAMGGLHPTGAAALGGGVAGLLVVTTVTRTLATPAAAGAAALLLLYGTHLLGLLAYEADLAAGVMVLLWAALVALWNAGRTRRPRVADLLLPLAALALALAQAMRAGPWPTHTPRAEEALFSSRAGVLFWSPVLWGGLFGLGWLGRRDRRAALSLLFAMTAGVFVLATSESPSRAEALRLAVSLVPLAAPGLALILDALVRLSERRPAVLVAMGSLFFVAWNLLFMHQYRAGEVPRDATVSFPGVAEKSAGTFARLFGSPPAWPANWAFAWRHGVSPDRFDLLAGKRLATAREIDVGDLPLDAALLGEGWSVRHPCGPEVCREVEGRARLFAPAESPGPFDLTVHAVGRGLLSLAVNGKEAGAQALSPELHALRFRVGGPWRRLNEVTLTLGAGGQALVDRLRLEPAGGGS